MYENESPFGKEVHFAADFVGVQRKVRKSMTFVTYILILGLIICNLATVFLIKKLMLHFTPEQFISNIFQIFSYKELYILIITGTLAVLLYMYINIKIELSRFIPTLTGLLALIATLMGVWFFNESFTIWKISGLVLILVGVFLISL